MLTEKTTRVTRADVAKRAGVSGSTVSYVLSGVRSISEETRNRVEHAMRELNYVPNAFAKALRGDASGLLALLYPMAERGFNLNELAYVEAASEAASESGFQLLMWPNPYPSLDSLREVVGQRLVEGVIVMELRGHDERVDFLVDSGIPFVLIGRTSAPDLEGFVDADFESAAELAIGHLLELGHHNIAYVSQSAALVAEEYSAVARMDAAMLRAAAEQNLELSVEHVGSNIAAGRDAFASLFGESSGITAVVGLNEPAMIGVLEEATRHGFEIPGDLSTIQLSMADHVADTSVPRQTTVVVDGGDLGRIAAHELIERIRGHHTVLRHLARFELAIRDSTGPAK